MVPQRFRWTWPLAVALAACWFCFPHSAEATNSLTAGLESTIAEVVDLVGMGSEMDAPLGDMAQLDRALEDLLGALNVKGVMDAEDDSSGAGSPMNKGLKNFGQQAGKGGSGGSPGAGKMQAGGLGAAAKMPGGFGGISMSPGGSGGALKSTGGFGGLSKSTGSFGGTGHGGSLSMGLKHMGRSGGGFGGITGNGNIVATKGGKVNITDITIIQNFIGNQAGRTISPGIAKHSLAGAGKMHVGDTGKPHTGSTGMKSAGNGGHFSRGLTQMGHSGGHAMTINGNGNIVATKGGKINITDIHVVQNFIGTQAGRSSGKTLAANHAGGKNVAADHGMLKMPDFTLPKKGGNGTGLAQVKNGGANGNTGMGQAKNGGNQNGNHATMMAKNKNQPANGNMGMVKDCGNNKNMAKNGSTTKAKNNAPAGGNPVAKNGSGNKGIAKSGNSGKQAANLGGNLGTAKGGNLGNNSQKMGANTNHSFAKTGGNSFNKMPNLGQVAHNQPKHNLGSSFPHQILNQSSIHRTAKAPTGGKASSGGKHK